MLHGSCVSERPACSRSAGGLAASAAVPGAAEQVTFQHFPVQKSRVKAKAVTITQQGLCSERKDLGRQGELVKYEA